MKMEFIYLFLRKPFSLGAVLFFWLPIVLVEMGLALGGFAFWWLPFVYIGILVAILFIALSPDLESKDRNNGVETKPARQYDWKTSKARVLRIEGRYNQMKNAHWLARLNSKYSKVTKVTKEDLRNIFGRFGS